MLASRSQPSMLPSPATIYRHRGRQLYETSSEQARRKGVWILIVERDDMNYPGHDAADPWWCFPGDDASSSFADMLADYSTDDLFDLAWEQGGEGAGGAPVSTTMPPAESCRLSSPPQFKPLLPPPPPPELPLGPPSEEQMAAWLSAIVKGEEEIAFTGDGREDVARKGSSDADASMSTDDTEEKLPITEGIGSKKEIKNPPEGGSSRRSHHGEAHNLTEKRRRNKIKDRLRTLQQLVPGCDKSNQASTLDQTIQYMKTLQHHVREMSVGPAHPAAAAIPVVPPRYAPPGAPVAVPMMPATPMVLAPAPTSMVPFEAMLQMPHYPTAVPVMMPAAAASLYPVAAPARVTVAPEDAGSSASHRQGSSRSKERRSSSSRSQKH